MANVDTCSWERGAFSAGTHGALSGALTLSAVIRVQEIPFSHVVNAAIGLAGALLLSSDRKAKTSLRAKYECQKDRAYPAR